MPKKTTGGGSGIGKAQTNPRKATAGFSTTGNAPSAPSSPSPSGTMGVPGGTSTKPLKAGGGPGIGAGHSRMRKGKNNTGGSAKGAMHG